MTTKLTNDGILYNDGSLQTIATTGTPADGWTKLSNGLIMQWNTFEFLTGSINNQVTITFPISFPTTMIYGWITPNNSSIVGGYSINPINKSSMALVRPVGDTGARGGYWFAIGY